MGNWSEIAIIHGSYKSGYVLKPLCADCSKHDAEHWKETVKKVFRDPIVRKRHP